jgi:AcrR family transcriptional regulator
MADVNGDELTRRLIDEAARLLAEQGPAGLSLRKLAAAVGTSTMTVYTRFGDKQGLLEAMYREGFRRLGERMRTATTQAADSLSLGRAYRLAALESPHLYGLMFGPPPPDLQPSADAEEAAEATYTPVVDAVRAAVERGALVGDPEEIALYMWAVVHGMISLELSGRLGGTPEDAARRYEEAMRLAARTFEPRAVDERSPS